MLDKHKKAISSVADSLVFDDFLDYLKTIVRDLSDLRSVDLTKETNESLKARALASQAIQEKLIDKFRVLKKREVNKQTEWE